MKKLLLILIVLTGLTSCYTENAPGIESNTSGDFFATLNFKVIEVGDCEYVYSICSSGGVMAHKGDCKNPIHGNGK